MSYLAELSIFLCSGKTEFQRVSMNRARRSVKFERRPSQRYSRRPKFDGDHSEKKKDISLSMKIDGAVWVQRSIDTNSSDFSKAN